MRFNDYDFNDDFIVQRVRTSILAPREVAFFRNTQGKHYVNQVSDMPMKIEVDIAVIKCNKDELKTKVREIAGKLKTKGLSRLFVEENMYYEAILTGETDLEELHGLGQATLQFVTPNFYSISSEEKEFNTTTGTNNGTADTYPTITLTVSGSTNQLSLINDNGNRIDLVGSFSAGDVIVLYLENPAYVTYNGVVDMTIVSMMSDLEEFSLKPGTWTLSGLSGATINLKYRERYL